MPKQEWIEATFDISEEAYDRLMAECRRTGETEGQVISRLVQEAYGRQHEDHHDAPEN